MNVLAHIYEEYSLLNLLTCIICFILFIICTPFVLNVGQPETCGKTVFTHSWQWFCITLLFSPAIK